MRILSENQKKRLQLVGQIKTEYKSLIDDGTTPFVAKQYLAKKYNYSVPTIYQLLKK